MNSSWKVFRTLSAASQIGMSLWRMYSASEQDQPPSVLLVGTFYKNKQETGRGVRRDDLMPRVRQPHQPVKGEPSYVHQSFPWRMCFASRNNKTSLHSSYSPFITHWVT